LLFFVFFDQMCTTLQMCISNHAFLVCFKYKCLSMPYKNFLLTSLAWSLQRNIGPWSLCTNLALRAWSVEKKISVRYFSVKTSRSVNGNMAALKKCVRSNTNVKCTFFYGQKHGGDLLPKDMKRTKWTIIKYK
jgi:hypothetical protein